MTDFTMKKDADGVAIITWDVPGKSMNVLSLDGAATLNTLIDEALADATVKGIVITSGKKDFAGGMDLNVFARIFALPGHRLFVRKVLHVGWWKFIGDWLPQ